MNRVGPSWGSLSWLSRALTDSTIGASALQPASISQADPNSPAPFLPRTSGRAFVPPWARALVGSGDGGAWNAASLSRAFLQGTAQLPRFDSGRIFDAPANLNAQSIASAGLSAFRFFNDGREPRGLQKAREVYDKVEDVRQGVETAQTVAEIYESLQTVGGGSALSGAGVLAENTLLHTGGWGDLLTGPAGSVRHALFGGGSSSATSGVAGATATNTGAVSGATTASGAGTTTAAASSGFASLGSLAQLGIIGAAVAAPTIFLSLRGGAREGAKTGKLAKDIDRLHRAGDHEGVFNAFADVIENRRWANESNMDDLQTFIDQGVLTYEMPAFFSDESRYDLFERPLQSNVVIRDTDGVEHTIGLLPGERLADKLGGLRGRVVRNETSGVSDDNLIWKDPDYYQQVYGMTETQATAAVSIASREPPPRADKNSDDYDYNWAPGWHASRQAELETFLAPFEANRREFARTSRARLQSLGYDRDITKLDAYLA